MLVLNERDQTVRYKLLAAKTERDFTADGKSRSVLGMESTVGMGSFAAWAKFAYAADEGQLVLLGLRAARVKLSAGEQAFMDSVRQETQADIGPGWMVSYDSSEARAVSGLEKKGLVRKNGAGEVELLGLGAARLRAKAAT